MGTPDGNDGWERRMGTPYAVRAQGAQRRANAAERADAPAPSKREIGRSPAAGPAAPPSPGHRRWREPRYDRPGP